MDSRFAQHGVGPLLDGLQSGLNTLLRHDPETLAMLAELEGKVIAIEVKMPDFRLFIVPDSGGVKLSMTEPGRVDVTVSGQIAALLGMLTAGTDTPINQGHVEVRGDIHLAQHLQSVLRQIDIDWEEWLAAYIGDTPARKLGRLGREVRMYLAEAGRSFGADVSEYLRFEQRFLPVRDEVERFLQDVDRLRDDVERVRQRLQRLERNRDMGS